LGLLLLIVIRNRGPLQENKMFQIVLFTFLQLAM